MFGEFARCVECDDPIVFDRDECVEFGGELFHVECTVRGR